MEFLISCGSLSKLTNRFPVTGQQGRICKISLPCTPIESIKRKVKDLKRLGRGFRNFEHFRNRFLYAARSAPPVYFEDNDLTFTFKSCEFMALNKPVRLSGWLIFIKLLNSSVLIQVNLHQSYIHHYTNIPISHKDLIH